MFSQVPLSRLHAGRRNPRRVAPDRQSHRRLVASIRTFGLLEPLVVRPNGDDRYEVIAGKRRLKALRTIHRKADPEIACHVTDVDAATADGMALAENAIRQDMHPIDEAEAYAKLARAEAKDVDAIAAAFGVRPRYVRQRMKLAALAEPIKTACRASEIDLVTAETFAAVPPDQQVAIWSELGGRSRNAQSVRAVIDNAWIEARHALFNVKDLPEVAVSSDLFTERVLIERVAFMTAQTAALEAEKAKLLDDGWAEVVVAERAAVYDRLISMNEAPADFDPETEASLQDLSEQRDALEQQYNALDDADEAALESVCDQIDTLDERERELIESAPRVFTEEVKATGTAFLLLMADGRIDRVYRVPRQARRSQSETESQSGEPHVPTCADLTDAQRAEINVHRTLATRLAASDDPLVLKRLLVLSLHPNVRRDAVCVRLDHDTSQMYLANNDCEIPADWQRFQERWAAVDPLNGEISLDECEAYDRLCQCTVDQLDAAITMLIVQRVECHLNRSTPLVDRLIDELDVNLRSVWRPHTGWLKVYRKLQLARLRSDLRGEAYYESGLKMKKSQLLEELNQLFAAADHADADLAARVQAWLPPDSVTSEHA